ncbi:MAG: SOS response-associated peptidase [Bacteroidota bacterium]|uniref:Abasic site processing protein n=1 Tax=Roseivirga thermotolerans TaxID=1758176 RepID=A0ABQ3I9M4_9BACT|nr:MULTISPECIES: SOS response-associated peptidase [Roseivirga]MEC7753893.1 SOS response-associated peptidase [Bacteroidota bacterium]GHE62587.1 putative SOS response-associated peptidase YoqW [Roseivirga thermotolerans]|tara:strand:- start:1606 stop:2304 length:699 start_codon:yes stop_codon:yes gene_type:complete
MLPNFSIASEAQLIQEHFSVEVPDNHQGTFNAQPTQLLPAITSADPDVLSYFYWGIHPSFTKSKGVSHKLLYAPVETLLSKASQRKSLKQQRCIIPADSFYDWKDLGKKEQVPYRFYLQNNSLFGIAGIWDTFETEDGEQVNTFMILTTEASGDVSEVTSRMPAILNEDLMMEWLNDSNTAESILEFVKPFSDEPIKHYTINPRLADPNFNGSALWEKVPPANQFGNLTLFS